MSSLWTRIVKEGQCSGRKGPGKGRSPAAARAPLSGPEREGRRLLQRLFLLRATAPPGMIRPGILARQPCTGAAAAPSTHPSWTHEDTSVHARGRDRSPEERRNRHITAAVMRLHLRQVCLITRRQTWLFQRPSSLTHPLPSGAWWRAAIKGRGVLIIRGEAADSSHSPPQATSPSSGRRPRRSATFLNQAPAVGVGGAGIPLRATLPLAPRRNRDRETGF